MHLSSHLDGVKRATHIKINAAPVLNVALSVNKRIFIIYKNKDRFNKSSPDAGIFFSNYEGNESVAEVGGKSNTDLSHRVHVYIIEYQVQNMNVNQLKYNLRKRKTSLRYNFIIIKEF